MTTSTPYREELPLPDEAFAQVDSRDPERADRIFVTIDGDRYYVVEDVDQMRPFLMSIVSDGDRWMFLSSSGALAAGRRDVHNALFPYETDDRLHQLGGLNGAVTSIRFPRDAGDVWRPLVGESRRHCSRTLYKSIIGNSVILEETDVLAGVTFRYRWSSSERLGFIRTATLINHRTTAQTVDLVDGIRNILPHGLDPSIYLPLGNLANAYKRSELIEPNLGLAVFTLEAPVSDKPEPAEVMRATTAWAVGLDEASVSLHPDAPYSTFQHGELEEPLTTGLPGAYFLCATLEIGPGENRSWSIVCDVGLDQVAVTELARDLRAMQDPPDELTATIRRGTVNLQEIMARGDALQHTADEVATSHHFSNVTYNIMRGGVPMEGYRIDMADFLEYLELRNRPVASHHAAALADSGPVVERSELLTAIRRIEDADLERLAHEYLPFSFSRRHGDPSRPWNAFSIRTTDDDGLPVNYFEGNWRDIFQNWEALAASFPEFLPGIVSVFVSASTADGYNPYRITSEGIDWEVPDPDDPWSNIGYWGDHQIVYLLRLLETCERYLPGTIHGLLGEARFAYADVPYRISPHEAILRDPKHTIDFDRESAADVDRRVATIGSDGRLLWRNGAVYNVTLAEKLLVPVLAKLSNFVPGGGVWMNTQRPEWNDANNALVGYGVSMVTLYQVRAYLAQLQRLVDGSVADVAMTVEVVDWLHSITEILSTAPVDETNEAADLQRKQLLDALGSSYSDYRRRIYGPGFTGTSRVPLRDLGRLCHLALAHIDATISANKRNDGLFQSYNLISISDDGERASLDRLGEMLEGQVAVIESGVLGPDECGDVVDALFASALFRADQHSFLLYPAERLPSFLDRNVVPPSEIEGNLLLSELLDESKEVIVVRDVDGRIRFDSDLVTRGHLEKRLDRIANDPNYEDLVAAHRAATLDIYERVFRHRSYTGRSGSMYAYEGIGSIYWHMVAKLLVAIQEAAFRFARSGVSPESLDRLVSSYWNVRSGLGFNKTPAEHGAIPIDPYSHTPSHAGAQQPGMTGLVKEELLIRPAELGVVVEEGEIVFDSTFLSVSELIAKPFRWRTLDVSLERQDLELPAGSFALTVCQVPVVVQPHSGDARIEVEHASGAVSHIEGQSLGKVLSAQVFGRAGQVRAIRAHLPPADSS